MANRGAEGDRDEASGAAPLGEQLRALEHALKGLHACGRAVVMAPRSRFDLRPAGRATEEAVTRALDAYDGRRDVVSSLTEAIAAADTLGAALRSALTVDPGLALAVEWADGSAAWLRKALASTPSRRIPMPRALQASVDVASLHAPARPTLAPAFGVIEPIAPPVEGPAPVDPLLPPAERLAMVRAQAEVRQRAAEQRREARRAARAAPKPPRDTVAPRPGFSPGEHLALSADAATRQRARGCFEDVAALGMMRAPQLGEDWRAMVTIDQRMLAAVDAIVSLGPVALGGIESFVMDAPAKDPTRGFAAAMILGSIEGRDVLAAVERVLAHLGTQEPENAEAVGEAFALAPNPDIPALLRTWLGDEDEALRAIAIGTLARRGLATPEQIGAALSDDSPVVIAAALVPAALSRHPDLAIRAEALVTHTHEAVTHELPWALVLGEVPFAISRLREWLGSPREDSALIPIALAGEKSDVEAIEALAAKKPTRARIAALGFGGLASSVPLLVDILRTGKDDELRLAAAFSLVRLTDAPLFDDARIPPDAIDVREPDEPDDPSPAAVPLAKRVGDARDLPAEGSADRAILPSTDPARWEAWLVSRGEPFAPDLRLRRGKPYTPALSLLELADYAIVPFDRRVLHRELVLKTGEALPFDAHAFVSLQQAALDAWAEPAERGSSQPGAWGRVRRRG